jgi:hypothetical protein
MYKELELLDENTVLLDGLSVKPSNCFRLSGHPPKVIFNTNCPEELKQKVEEILLKYESRESNISYFYTVEFDLENVHYEARLTPEFRMSHEIPSSWHVVLNEVFFGHLHKDQDQWASSEQRPGALVEKVGSLIDSKAYQTHAI